MAILDRAIVRLLPAVPKPVVRRISERYIAGTELADACRVVARLNDEGKMGTIDVLGEEIANAEEARAISSASSRFAISSPRTSIVAIFPASFSSLTTRHASSSSVPAM